MAIKQWSVKFRDARDQVIHVQVVTCHHAHNAPKMVINHTTSIEVTAVQAEAGL